MRLLVRLYSCCFLVAVLVLVPPAPRAQACTQLRLGAAFAVAGRDPPGRVVADHAMWRTFFVHWGQCAGWGLPEPYL